MIFLQENSIIQINKLLYSLSSTTYDHNSLHMMLIEHDVYKHMKTIFVDLVSNNGAFYQP